MKTATLLGAMATILVSSAAAAGEHAAGGLGESCASRSDCEEGLKCVRRTCTDGKQPIDSGSEHDEAAPGSGQRTAGKVLFITGISVFGVGWLGTGIATTAIVSGNSRSRTILMGEAWVPLAGPYIMLADSFDYSSSQVAATAVGALIQTLGFTTMMVGAILWPSAPSSSSREGRLLVVPWTGNRSAGISVGGSF
jgi:hypothetical protein